LTWIKKGADDYPALIEAPKDAASATVKMFPLRSWRYLEAVFADHIYGP